MKIAVVVIAFVVLTYACSDNLAPLVASDVSIARPRAGIQMTAAYLELTNNSSQKITITNVTSPEFESVQMHESVIEEGIAKMFELDALTILPGKSVVFEPGAKHLMLMHATGETENVTLEFIADQAVVLNINVAVTN